MASSSKPKGTYDVFLSFKGTLRKNFIGHLYKELVQQGIYTFRDSEELRMGDQISPMLLKAIEESRIAIIVFSEDYASSHWCLEEVAKIMECKKQKNLIVIPVFYKVAPREVRTGRESYARALAKHESKYINDPEKVKRWKEALFEASNLSGQHLNDGDESELIQKIVKEISTRLDRKSLHVAKHPVWIRSQVAKLKLMLNLESNDGVLMLGLWGQGGIGKTTLAKALYNAIYGLFEGSCYLADVRENSKDGKGLVSLQEKLLLEILPPQQTLVVSSVDRGINLIRDRLRWKKVLLILDDVDHWRQLDALAGEDRWFGNGSRIIITTRDIQLLTCSRIDHVHVYEVKPMDRKKAHDLLTKHASQTQQKLKIKKKLVNGVLDIANGLPLALEVLGSSLHGTAEHVWESTIKKISKDPNKDINNVLKVSFDGLDENEKEIFLHIACFFKGKASEYTKKVLDSCDHETIVGFDILVKRSLISIQGEILEMHDLIQAMGKDIVNQECKDDPGRRSRLWLYDDVVDVLSRDMGTNAVKAIVLALPKPTEMCIKTDAFVKLRRLRLLILHNVHDSFQGPRYLPNDLRWFEWPGCASQVPKFSNPKKLAGLNLSKGNVTGVLKQFKDFPNLQYINFSGCELLVCMPDFSCTPNLWQLDLQCCERLVEAHDSIASHDKLQVLNLNGCSKLSIFPNELKSKNLRTLNLDGCTKFEKFPNIPHKLKGLENLYLQGTAIKELPTSIENLVSLEGMYLDDCKNLESLPSSIYKLQNIRTLELSNCTNFIKFPKYDGSVDPCMNTGLPNLRWLALVGCNLSEVEFLENLSCFPSLIELYLRENNITSLPASIKKRNHLRGLDIQNCPQLQEITELPPFLRWLWADNLESLRKNGDLTLIHHLVRRGLLTMAHMSLIDQGSGNILSRTQSGKKDNQQPSPAVDNQHLRHRAPIPPNVYYIHLVGDEMPEWIIPIEEGCVSFMISKDIYDKFLGLAFCFVTGNEIGETTFEISPHVNDKRRDCKGEMEATFFPGHIALRYFITHDLWGEVDFGQIDGSYVHFSLTISTKNVKKLGLRIICEPLEDDLKVQIQDNMQLNPALLCEVQLESINLEAESLLTHKDSLSEADLHKHLQDCQRSTEKPSQIVSKRNHKLILPQGTQTPVQRPEVRSPTNSVEQANTRTSGIGGSKAGEPESEPINDPSATGSGTAPALMSIMMPTASTESMPSQGAAETVDLPSTKPSTVADRLEAGKKIPKERRSSYQAAIDKKGELTEEKERLELLAEVERQIELNSIHIQHEGRSMKQPFSEVQATAQECHRQRAEVERHLFIKRECMEDNETLDEHLSTFRSSVKRRLDSARQDSSSKADPQVDLQDCQTSIEEHSQIVPQRTPELFFPEASEPRPRGLLIRLAEMSVAVFARCFCS